ncbi:MAG: nuclease domain-containing protein [Desulfosporosinus sp.]|nr:nuclease domain-containing protein [Desulfosporosinus sp.]
MKKKYELLRQDIIRVQRGGLFVTLDQSQKASVTYRNPKNGETFDLLYQSRTLFGEKESEVSWLGKIERWEVVPRGQIKERPARRGREGELYVRLRLKSGQGCLDW